MRPELPTRRAILSCAMAMSLALYRAARAQDSLTAERLRQKTLPHAQDPFWDKLKACKVDLDAARHIYRLTPTPDIKAMEGHSLMVQGFILPLDGTDKTRHFLIGVNTPVCFYHPPGEPNELMEVFSIKPVTWSDQPMYIKGRFTQVDEASEGVFFRLEEAEPVRPPSFLSHLPGLSGSPSGGPGLN